MRTARRRRISPLLLVLLLVGLAVVVVLLVAARGQYQQGFNSGLATNDALGTSVVRTIEAPTIEAANATLTQVANGFATLTAVASSP